jgi:hypothetical protein
LSTAGALATSGAAGDAVTEVGGGAGGATAGASSCLCGSGCLASRLRICWAGGVCAVAGGTAARALGGAGVSVAGSTGDVTAGVAGSGRCAGSTLAGGGAWAIGGGAAGGDAPAWASGERTTGGGGCTTTAVGSGRAGAGGAGPTSTDTAEVSPSSLPTGCSAGAGLPGAIAPTTGPSGSADTGAARSCGTGGVTAATRRSEARISAMAGDGGAGWGWDGLVDGLTGAGFVLFCALDGAGRFSSRVAARGGGSGAGVGGTRDRPCGRGASGAMAMVSRGRDAGGAAPDRPWGRGDRGAAGSLSAADAAEVPSAATSESGFTDVIVWAGVSTGTGGGRSPSWAFSTAPARAGAEVPAGGEGDGDTAGSTVRAASEDPGAGVGPSGSTGPNGSALAVGPVWLPGTGATGVWGTTGAGLGGVLAGASAVLAGVRPLGREAAGGGATLDAVGALLAIPAFGEGCLEAGTNDILPEGGPGWEIAETGKTSTGPDPGGTSARRTTSAMNAACTSTDAARVMPKRSSGERACRRRRHIRRRSGGVAGCGGGEEATGPGVSLIALGPAPSEESLLTAPGGLDRPGAVDRPGRAQRVDRSCRGRCADRRPGSGKGPHCTERLDRLRAPRGVRSS